MFVFQRYYASNTGESITDGNPSQASICHYTRTSILVYTVTSYDAGLAFHCEVASTTSTSTQRVSSLEFLFTYGEHGWDRIVWSVLDTRMPFSMMVKLYKSITHLAKVHCIPLMLHCNFVLFRDFTTINWQRLSVGKQISHTLFYCRVWKEPGYLVNKPYIDFTIPKTVLIFHSNISFNKEHCVILQMAALTEVNRQPEV